MTEDEAKTRWCPFARFKFSTSSDNPSSNREGGPSASQNPWLVSGTRCLASECMAWRWEPSIWEYVNVNGMQNPQAAKPGDDWERTDTGWRRLLPRGGFCGLAGRPE